MATDRLCFNISGRYFHTKKSDLKGRMASMISKGFEDAGGEKGEYFYSGHAGCFEAVLDYYQHGELHMPLSVCPAVFSRELEYWGISHEEVSTCCKIRLETFEDEMEITHILSQYDRQMLFTDSNKQSCFQFIHRSVVNPHYSLLGKMYFWVSMIFVALSVFNLCAETHPLFKNVLLAEEWTDYFGDTVDSYQNELHKLFPEYFDQIVLSEYHRQRSEDDEYGEEVTALNRSFYEQLNRTRFDKQLPENARSIKTWVRWIGYVCGMFFTLDIVMRFFVCPSKRKFFVSFLNSVDILSLLPFYTELIVYQVDITHRYTTSVVNALNVVSVVRVFRVFRLAKQSKGLHVFLLSLKTGIRDILLLLFFLAIATLVFASLVYHAETSGKFKSIPDGFWWAIVTMTTVGYGDIYPESFMGKIVGSFCMVCGVLVMAVTVPIFASKFALYYQRTGKRWCLKAKKKKTVISKSNFVEPICHKN